MASILGAFLLVLWWVGEEPDRYRRGWVYLFIGAIPPIAVAVWQWVSVSGNLEIAGINRLQGTFGHPHTFGPYLVPFILYCVAGLPTAKFRGRVVRMLAAAGLMVLLARTYSRTAELVLLTGLVALPLSQAKELGVRAVIRGLGAVVVFGIVGWLIAGSFIRERFAGIRIGAEALDAARTGETENSFEWRLVNWGGLIVMGMEHPYAGHGLGMTPVLNALVDPATDLPYTAHDDFVRVFFETGFLGLTCYLLYGLLLCRWALGVARAAPGGSAPSAFGVVCALIALFFLTGGAQEFGTQTAVQYEVYGMLGLMTALRSPSGVVSPGSAGR
jgi:O-Antigen ligase